MIDPLVRDGSRTRGIAAFVSRPLSASSAIDPTIVLALIEQAGEGRRRLEVWQASIQVQAGTLLSKVREERTASSARIGDLVDEIADLRRRIVEATAATAAATAERDDALKLYEAAEARAVRADQKAAAAGKRAEMAEDMLTSLQDLITTEFVPSVAVEAQP